MENNELLIEYLGLKFYIHAQTGDVIKGSAYAGSQEFKWRPDTDWNHLMMVVEKIEKEGRRVDIQLKGCDIYEKQKISPCEDWNIVLAGETFMYNRDITKIEAVYNACVEYIKTKS